MKQNKRHTQIHGVTFMLANYSWAWGLPWVWLIDPGTPPRENWFSLYQQLLIAEGFLVKGGTLSALPSSAFLFL